MFCNSAEVWCIQLNDSVIDIAHLPEGKVFAALADGSIAVLQVQGIFSSLRLALYVVTSA